MHAIAGGTISKRGNEGLDQEACVICGGQDNRIARHARSSQLRFFKRVRQAIARRDRHVAPARMLC
jgi:hypothetical protein